MPVRFSELSKNNKKNCGIRKKSLTKVNFFSERLFKNSDTKLRINDLDPLIQGRDISKLDTDTAETLEKEITETEV